MTTTETATTPTAKWTPQWEKIGERDLSVGLRWDTPRRNQGQTVEVSYADSRPMASPAGCCGWKAGCAAFKRVHDRSNHDLSYYRLAN